MPKLDPHTRAVEEIPDSLKPYLFHGLELSFRSTDKEAKGECPFCGSEKFSVDISTGKWRCFVCNEGEDHGEVIKGGNATVFIRKLWEMSDKSTKEYTELSENRGLLYPETLVDWNICKSLITDNWLIPGWSWSDGDKQARMTQLYQYMRNKNRMVLFPTSELGAKLFGLNLFDPKKPNVFICESIWDALVWSEVLKLCKRDGSGKLIPTSNVGKSLWAESNVIATPGCNTFFEAWCKILADKNVIMLTHNDHPKKHPKTGQTIPPAGFTGASRTMTMLSQAAKPPASISALMWGPEGYNKDKPSGYDPRDRFKEAGNDPKSRIAALQEMLGMVVPFAGTSNSQKSTGAKNGGPKYQGPQLDQTSCFSYKELVNCWRKAMKWTDGLDHALSIMLSCIASTRLLGDQLWFMVISPPSTGKSTLCEALSANKDYVIAKSTIRGFHSGYKTDADGEEDNSLIPSIKDKTLIVKDADSLLTAPNKEQILGEARDLYDCTSRAHYRSGISREYVGIRMTMLLCGTAALRGADMSELGARFLVCVIMDHIDEELEHEVGWRVVNRADMMMAFESDGQLESHQSPEMTRVMQMTSGYVTHLRENVLDMMSLVEVSDKAKEFCVHLGKFVSYMRARPSKKQDEAVEREFSARLISQLYRATKCLAVVLNKATLDDPEVMSRIRKVAIDTAQGQTYQFALMLYEAGKAGRDIKWLSLNADRSIMKINEMLRFLRQIKVVERFQVEVRGIKGTKVKYRLTETLQSLFREVLGEQEDA